MSSEPWSFQGTLFADHKMLSIHQDKKEPPRTKDGCSSELILSHDVGGYGILFTWDSKQLLTV